MVRFDRHANVLCMTAAATLVACLIPLPAFAACNWQRTPISDSLFSISAIGPSDIWAAGNHFSSGTLLYRWDGAQWSSVQVPIPQQVTSTTFVSATADNNVWAVSTYFDGSGNLQPYAIHFDGTQWTESLLQTELPAAPQALYVQAFASNDVWAVGSVPYSGQNVQEVYAPEHWNGTSWSTGQFEFPTVHGQRSPGFQIDALEGVSSTDLWAVGRISGIRPLFEHFDGARWRIAPDPTLTGILIVGVHAISSTDVWGVGYTTDRTHRFRTYAVHWDGNVWSYVPTPNFDRPYGELSNSFGAVSGSGPKDVWAVGTVDGGHNNIGLLAEHWNGTSWTIVRNPPVMGAGALTAVADISPQDVWAVGLSGLGVGIADFWCSPAR